jgi:hypothetical protein
VFIAYALFSGALGAAVGFFSSWLWADRAFESEQDYNELSDQYEDLFQSKLGREIHD